MAIIMGNVGLADDLRQRLLQALLEGRVVFLVLDQARTVEVDRTSVHNGRQGRELSVDCTDIEDGTTIILHLPYAPDMVATALIQRPKTEGE